jgi:DNA repair ATPase RecN
VKISRIKIKNLFGIKEYEAGGENVELTGKNGVGKSSVIDAIRLALENKSDRDYIVRSGETEGEILIETDTGLSIDRKIRTQSSDYKSVKQNGNVIKSPEAFLAGIFTKLQLQPIEFMNMSKKDQNRIILDMIEYEWDLNTIKEWFGEIPQDVNYQQNILAVLNDIQAENGYYFQTRQDINRDIREKRAVVEDIKNSLPIGYDGAEWEDADLGDLYMEIEKRRKNNEMIEKAQTMLAGHDAKIRGLDADKEIKLATLDRQESEARTRYNSEISSLKEQINTLMEKLSSIDSRKADRVRVIESEYQAGVAKIESEIESYAEYRDREKLPVDDLLNQARNIEKMKGHVNEWRRMQRVEKEAEELKEKSDLLTKKIEKARSLPGEILETATIPIEGLSVQNGVPLINGLPVSNLSEGEKLDLCIDVAIQNRSGLQIVLIDGIEKLATPMREHMYQKCKEKGVQFIATRTTDDNDLIITEL